MTAGWLSGRARFSVSVTAKLEWELTERDVGEEVVRDVVVRDLWPWRKSDVGHARIGRCERARRRTLWKKNRPIQPSVGRSTVAAAPLRNDHSSWR